MVDRTCSGFKTGTLRLSQNMLLVDSFTVSLAPPPLPAFSVCDLAGVALGFVTRAVGRKLLVIERLARACLKVHPATD